MFWQCVSKLLAEHLVLFCMPISQATYKLRLAFSHMLSTCIHTHVQTKYTDSHELCYFQQYCTLSCAMSYWHFSGTLLHLFISFSTAVFSLFHNQTFVFPLISKKCLVWILTHGQQLKGLKRVFQTCRVNASSPRSISLLLVLQSSVSMLS